MKVTRIIGFSIRLELRYIPLMILQFPLLTYQKKSALYTRSVSDI